MVLIPLSRIYLGVHWPLDIIFGITIGLAVSTLYPVFISLYDDEQKMKKITYYVSPIAIIGALVISVLIDSGILNETLYKDIATAFSCWGSVMVATVCEKKYVNFARQDGWLKILLCYALSLSFGALVTLVGIGSIGVMHRFFKTLAYVLLILWEMFLWPLLGIKLKLFKRA